MSALVKFRKKFGAFSLSVDFEAENEVLALLGGSGCGKSMTLKCIAGIVTPDEGKIVVDGVTFFDSERGVNLKPQQRRCGLLFQNYALFPNMTAKQKREAIDQINAYVLAMSDAQMSDSCGYEEERFDESGLAKQTADILGRENSRCLITPEEYFGIVPYVMYNMEQPLGDASAIAFTIACNETAKHTKLCYSGEGADEFFGGYNMYRNAERYGDNLKTFYVGNTNIMKEDEKKQILKKYDPDVLPIELVQHIYEETEGLDPLTKMSDVDIQIWLEGDIYLNVDKMSTAAGLEIRMPLTDRRIFDIASRMPARFKVNEEQNKVAFRTAAAKVLPDEIAFRKKLGFIVPIRIWMADERYNGDVRRLFHSEIAEKFFKVDEIQAIFDDYVGGNSDNWRKVWTIYTFLVWYEEYFVKR